MYPSPNLIGDHHFGHTLTAELVLDYHRLWGPHCKLMGTILRIVPRTSNFLSTVSIFIKGLQRVRSGLGTRDTFQC